MFHHHCRSTFRVSWIGLMTISVSVNTFISRQNGHHLSDDIFKSKSANENIRISIAISLKFVPKGPFYNMPALVHIMDCTGQATSHYLNQWWLIYWHIYALLGFKELRNYQPDKDTNTVIWQLWHGSLCIIAYQSRLPFTFPMLIISMI